MLDELPLPNPNKICPAISLQVLGSPCLTLDNQPLRLAYAKAEALFYYLAVTGRPHSRATLSSLLWSHTHDKQARGSLRNALYTIRQALRPLHPLRLERETVELDGSLVRLDTHRFQPLIEQNDDLDTLAAALALWRGDFLEGLSLADAPVFEEWVAEQRSHFAALYHQGLLRLSQLYSAAQQGREAQRTIEKLLALDPLHEEAHRHLMRLQLHAGNRAAALRQYETLRSLLIEELGIDPDPATQALHLELLHAETILPPPTLLRRQLGPYQFVGRKREMALLHEFYRATLPHGPAGMVMLEGEPGIGKTRLAHEWLATLPHTRTLATRCFETEQVIPFQPWIDLIRTTLKQPAWPQLSLADGWLTELAQLVPEIRLRRPDLEPGPVTNPELARGRIIQAIYHWLETICQAQPLCLFIDDLQWLDQASLALLRYIFRPQQSHHLPLLIVGTQREGEPMPGWAQLKSSLDREGILHHLLLYRLSLAEVVALARAVGLPPHIQTDIFLTRLLQETEGNPLFIIEFMQMLRQTELEAEAQWPIPPTIHDVIHSRLNRLSRETNHLLAAAAVLGRGFSDSQLQQVSDLSLENTLQAIDEAIAANLIIEQAGTYDFTHDKIRAVLRDSLTQSRRRYLHLRVAGALEATLANDFGLLSYHFEKGGDLLRARNYGLRAARQAVELYADEDALTWYAKVESLFAANPAELSPEAIPKVIPFQQIYISRTLPLDVLGVVYRQRGLILQRVGQYPHAEEVFRSALERGRQRRRLDEQAAAHNLLSFLAYLRSDYNGVGHHAQQALDLATEAGEIALQAPGLRHLGIAVYRTGDYGRARQLYDEALLAYRQVGDRLGMAGVYNNIGFVLRTEAHYTEAIAAFQEALALYREMGQVEGIALIHSNIGRTYAFSGDLTQARQHLEQGLALSQEANTDWITVKIHRTLGNVFFQNRQWPEALSHARQAQHLAEALGSPEDLGAILRLLAELAEAWPDSRLDDPSHYFEQSISLLRQVGAHDELERAEAAFAAYRAAAQAA